MSAKKLKCPKCLAPLRTKREEALNVDSCSSCKGIWLEKGELSYLTKTWKDLPFVDTKKGKRVRKTPLNCPKCKVPLVEFYYDGKNEEIYIEKCNSCSGIWLDFYEFEQIKSKVESTRTPGIVKSLFKGWTLRITFGLGIVIVIILLILEGMG